MISPEYISLSVEDIQKLKAALNNSSNLVGKEELLRKLYSLEKFLSQNEYKEMTINLRYMW